MYGGKSECTVLYSHQIKCVSKITKHWRILVKLDQLGLFWLQSVAAKFAGTKAVTIGAFVGPYVVYYSRKVEIFKTTMLLPCLVVAVL
jgi:hypothetical protein